MDEDVIECLAKKMQSILRSGGCPSRKGYTHPCTQIAIQLRSKWRDGGPSKQQRIGMD